MLFYLLSWILLVTSGAAVGSAVLAITKSSAFSHFGDRMITAIWLGLLTIATVLLGLSVVLPLSPGVGLCVLAILTIVAAFFRAVRQDFKALRLCGMRAPTFSLGILAAAAALSSTRLVEAYDTGLYHYQLTRWLAEYGTIRGLALIHIVFGFSSSWFALAAPFDFGPFQGRVAALLGGLAIFLCLVHFALAVSRIIQRRADRADWFLIGGYIVVLGVSLSWAFEVSLSPDVPSWILAMLVAWLMLITHRSSRHESSASEKDGSAILPLVLAVGAGAVKLSAGPAVLVALLFYWLNSPSKWTPRLVAPGVVGLLLIPKAATGVVSSGCPFFPNPLLCLDVPWGFGSAAARIASDNIRDWARWSGPMPAWADNWNWMLPWISHLDRMALISFCAICFMGFLAARGWRTDKSLLYVLGLAVFSTIFLFVSAPNPRFGAGYLALYPALFLAAVGPKMEDLLPSRSGEWWKPSSSPRTLGYVLIAMAALFAGEGSLREIRLRRELRTIANLRMPSDSNLWNRLLLPPVLPHSEGDLIIIRNRRMDLLEPLNLTSERTNGIDYLHPKEGDQCWGAALPCLPRSLDGDVVLRLPGDGLPSGFTRSATLDKVSKR
jgi:hypothetical protein